MTTNEQLYPTITLKNLSILGSDASKLLNTGYTRTHSKHTPLKFEAKKLLNLTFLYELEMFGHHNLP